MSMTLLEIASMKASFPKADRVSKVLCVCCGWSGVLQDLDVSERLLGHPAVFSCPQKTCKTPVIDARHLVRTN
jgi:hypothetical protein